MRADAIRRFLLALGLDSGDIVMEREYVNAPCPMAFHTHAAGADTRPSFGIRVSNEGRSFYFCFGCTPEAKRLESLLHNIWLMSGEYPSEAARIFAQEENHDGSGRKEPIVNDVWEQESRPVPNPLGYDVIRRFPLLQFSYDGDEAEKCMRYFSGRGIAPWAAKMLDVRHDPDSRAVVFPMTDVTGRIFVMRVRSRLSKNIWTVSPKLLGMPEELSFPKLKDVGVWFGMHLVNWKEPIMLVEDATDMLRLVTLGYFNVLASMTSSVTVAQIDALCSSTLILGYDADKAGRDAHRKIANMMRGQNRPFEVDWSVASGCVDAGDLACEEDLRKVLSKTKLVSS